MQFGTGWTVDIVCFVFVGFCVWDRMRHLTKQWVTVETGAHMGMGETWADMVLWHGSLRADIPIYSLRLILCSSNNGSWRRFRVSTAYLRIPLLLLLPLRDVHCWK